jgi:hypothetical protein
MKVEYFPTHLEAQKCKSKHEVQGRVAEVVPRLRCGVVIYAVRSAEKDDSDFFTIGQEL